MLAPDGLGMWNKCKMLTNDSQQAPLEMPQNVTRMDRWRDWAVTKATTSCPSERHKHHWEFWRTGHTSQWLAAAVVLMTTESRGSQNHRYISHWAANQGLLPQTAQYKGRDALHVHYLWTGQRFCLLVCVLDLFGKLQLLPAQSLFSTISPTPRHCCSPSRTRLPFRL